MVTSPETQAWGVHCNRTFTGVTHDGCWKQMEWTCSNHCFLPRFKKWCNHRTGLHGQQCVSGCSHWPDHTLRLRYIAQWDKNKVLIQSMWKKTVSDRRAHAHCQYQTNLQGTSELFKGGFSFCYWKPSNHIEQYLTCPTSTETKQHELCLVRESVEYALCHFMQTILHNSYSPPFRQHVLSYSTH